MGGSRLGPSFPSPDPAGCGTGQGRRGRSLSCKVYNAFRTAMAPSEIIFSVQEAPEGGYQARALGYSIFTEADSLEELKTMVREAVSCHFDAATKPSVIRLNMVKDEVISA